MASEVTISSRPEVFVASSSSLGEYDALLPTQKFVKHYLVSGHRSSIFTTLLAFLKLASLRNGTYSEQLPREQIVKVMPLMGL